MCGRAEMIQVHNTDLRSASVRRALAEKEATIKARAQEACVASTTTPLNLRNCARDASSPRYCVYMCVLCWIGDG